MIPGKNIGAWTRMGADAYVVADVPADVLVVGVSAGTKGAEQ